MGDNRKKWCKPQLIVLGRGTPEENVLANCKSAAAPAASGANASRDGCKDKSKGQCNAADCSVVGTS